MKNTILISFLFLSSFVFAQGGPKVDVIKFRGEITTTIRDTFDVPSGEHWVIYNTTTGQYEQAASDDVWSSFGGGSGDVTGPASSTDNSIPRFDGTTGKLLQGSGVIISNGGDISGVDQISATGIDVQNGNVSNVRVFDFEITDTEPSSFEGRIYGDNSENRPKYYDGTSWKAFLLDGDAAGTDSQTLSLSGTDLSISSGNTVDLSGVGGAAEYRNPDIHYVTRASGTDVTDAWFETTGEEGKRTINTSTSSNPAAPNFYEIATFSSNKSAILRSVLRGGSPLVLTSDDYNIIGSGTAVVDIDAGETDGVIGVYIDSLNAIQITKAPAALPSDVIIDGYFKPYSISQVTGLASSNITTTAFDISWDAATASVGTISNYEYSIDGGTPVAVTGATSASVTGLTESTAYNVNVRAVDAGGNKGQYSADLSVTTTSSFTPLWAANAATPTPNEVAGSAGFIDASNYTVSTVTSPTTNGTHAISITRTADGSSSADIGLQFQNLTIGQSYDFTFSIQITSGSPNNNYVRTNGTYSADWTVSDLVEYGTGNTGNWETYTLTMTPAVTNPRMRFNSSALAGVNTNGMVTLFDNLVITEN